MGSKCILHFACGLSFFVPLLFMASFRSGIIGIISSWIGVFYFDLGHNIHYLPIYILVQHYKCRFMLSIAGANWYLSVLSSTILCMMINPVLASVTVCNKVCKAYGIVFHVHFACFGISLYWYDVFHRNFLLALQFCLKISLRAFF